MNFSVLMCVYAGDTLQAFQQAFNSCTADQTVKPAEVIIMRNGQVHSDVEDFLHSVESSKNDLGEEPANNCKVHVIRLEKNQGLAHALNLGLAEVSTDWVARMDADHISLPHRFEKQCTFLASHPNVDVLGTALQEFTEPASGVHQWGEKRILPASGEDLLRYARLQSPVHHPTVMLRVSAVREAGGYPEDSGRFEDYLLWERMILHGARFANLPGVLLGYRVDAGAYNRRGGLNMFRSELSLQKTFLHDGFTTRGQFIRNLAIRGVYRLIPTGIKKPLYRLRTAAKNKSF